MSAPSPGEPAWALFDRSRPPGASARVRLFGITMLALLVYALAREATSLDLLGALQSEVGRLRFARTLAGVALAGMLLLNGLYVGRARRRFGRCELSPYRARFVLFGRPLSVVEINQEDVRGWTRTPFGVLVHVEGRGPLRRILQPLLIPTASDQEVARVESLLRGETDP